MDEPKPLTDRQLHEVEYHKTRADEFAADLPAISFDIATSPRRRWWNAHWTAFTWLKGEKIEGRQALVVGCGLADDAMYLARLGAKVRAFDLSPDMIAQARRLVQRERMDVQLDILPAERLTYADNSFDLVLVRDILHHVDIAGAMAQIVRVARPGALLLVDEVYTHSWLQRIRTSWLVDRVLYRRLQAFVYGKDKPYITPDEGKLSQRDVGAIWRQLTSRRRRYFNFLTNRLYSHRFVTLAKLDAAFLKALSFLGPLLGSRVLLMGRIRK